MQYIFAVTAGSPSILSINGRVLLDIQYIQPREHICNALNMANLLPKPMRTLGGLHTTYLFVHSFVGTLRLIRVCTHNKAGLWIRIRVVESNTAVPETFGDLFLK